MTNELGFMSVTVIIPTLNEIVGIKKIVPKLKKEWADEWLFVDGDFCRAEPAVGIEGLGGNGVSPRRKRAGGHT